MKKLMITGDFYSVLHINKAKKRLSGQMATYYLCLKTSLTNDLYLKKIHY